jgi:hypothetical protein
MNNKKWFHITLSISVLSYMVMVVIYIAIDAEMVFNNSLTNKKFGYTEYYSKYQFDKLKYNQYSLIFGTSRSQKLSSSMLNINILNFHGIYGQPDGILNFLLQLNQKQIQNIKQIYYLVSIATMNDEASVVDYKSNTFIDKLTHILPLSALSMKYTVRDLKYNIFKDTMYYYIDDDGSLNVNDKDQSAILNKKITYDSTVDIIKKTNSINALLKLNKFCIDNNILITYYTPTFSDKVIVNVETINYLWATLLDGGISGFYELYYISGVSDNKLNNLYYNFTDETHLNYNSMNKTFKRQVLDADNTRYISNTKELNRLIKNLKITIKDYR